MLVTVIVVVATHNLAFGVLAGVLLAALFFANKVGHYMLVTSELDEQTGTRRYTVAGQVFFSSSEKFLESDRKSTRLNSSHVRISYAVFCLKKKKKKKKNKQTINKKYIKQNNQI